MTAKQDRGILEVEFVSEFISAGRGRLLQDEMFHKNVPPA
jgi:hypothetical protein